MALRKRICAYHRCGKEFQPVHSYQWHCDKFCRSRARRDPFSVGSMTRIQVFGPQQRGKRPPVAPRVIGTKICANEWCAQPFEITHRNKDQQYCGVSCANSVKSVNWHAKRKAEREQQVRHPGNVP